MHPDSDIHFAEINTNGKTPRSRRPHQKTKTGCDSCKARKIKCDERFPRCSACHKRDTACIRSGQIGSSSTASTPATLIENPTSSKYEIDLLSLKLFHHFEHFTISTLAFCSEDLWKDTIRLAIEHKYLMHSVLSMAAAHINFEQPGDARIVEAELYHQSAAISGLREALNMEITASNSDALFACSMLLYHHAWTRTDDDGDDPSLAIDFPHGLRDLIPLGTGIRGLVMETVISRTGIWQETMAYSPRVALNMCMRGTRFPEVVEARFEEQYLAACPEDPNKASWKYEAFMTECRRLIPVISTLRLREEGSDTTLVTKSVVRYLFTWPVLLGDGFFELMRQRDPLWELILFHFFQAVVRPKIMSMWWSKKRANFMLQKITENFTETGVRVVNLYRAEGENIGPIYLDLLDPNCPGLYRRRIDKEMQDAAPIRLGG